MFRVTSWKRKEERGPREPFMTARTLQSLWRREQGHHGVCTLQPRELDLKEAGGPEATPGACRETGRGLPGGRGSPGLGGTGSNEFTSSKVLC